MRTPPAGQLVLGTEATRPRRATSRRDPAGGKESNPWWGLQGALGPLVLCVYPTQVPGPPCQATSPGDKRPPIRSDVRMPDCSWKSQQVAPGPHAGGGRGPSGCLLEGVRPTPTPAASSGNQGAPWWAGVSAMREEPDSRPARPDRGPRAANGGQPAGGVPWPGGWGFTQIPGMRAGTPPSWEGPRVRGIPRTPHAIPISGLPPPSPAPTPEVGFRG